MKLFDQYEAVFFPEENQILITANKYLYYIYDCKYDHWHMKKNGGFDRITVENYKDISREELMKAMKGVFPNRETDFLRLCHPSEYRIIDMLDLLEEDYPDYMSFGAIYHASHALLKESDICMQSYLKLRKLLDDARDSNKDAEQTLQEVKQLALDVIGRDIFKKEIGIVDGHDPSSYFWIQPVRVIDYSDTTEIDNVAEMNSVEISIEEDDVASYLLSFLYKYFDDELEANKKRVDDRWVDENGNEQATYHEGFEWYLTHNFYTFDSVRKLLQDIRDTIDALSSGRETEYTRALRVKGGFATYELTYAGNMSQEQIAEYNSSRPTLDEPKAELLIDFYQRFLYRMEYMLRVGEEKGYNLISFMGP